MPAGSLWGLTSSDLAWPSVSPYPSHSLWAHDNPHLHPGQYQPELFGFTGEIWGGGRGPGHGRQLLQYQKQAKKRRRVATASQRRAANIRERRRMFNLNESFDRLRSKVSQHRIISLYLTLQWDPMQANVITFLA